MYLDQKVETLMLYYLKEHSVLENLYFLYLILLFESKFNNQLPKSNLDTDLVRITSASSIITLALQLASTKNLLVLMRQR